MTFDIGDIRYAAALAQEFEGTAEWEAYDQLVGEFAFVMHQLVNDADGEIDPLPAEEAEEVARQYASYIYDKQAGVEPERDE